MLILLRCILLLLIAWLLLIVVLLLIVLLLLLVMHLLRCRDPVLLLGPLWVQPRLLLLLLHPAGLHVHIHRLVALAPALLQGILLPGHVPLLHGALLIPGRMLGWAAGR